MGRDTVKKVDKFKRQNVMYQYPYHHIPHFDEDGCGIRTRMLNWGFEYLSLIKYVSEKVISMSPKSVLEVGCGDGAILQLLSSEIESVTGADLSHEAIAFAQAFSPDVKCYADDAKNVKGAFDLVMAIEVLEHIPDELVDGFVTTLCEKTKSGGHIVISVPTTNMELNKKHYRHYTKELLTQHLGAISDKVELVETNYFYQFTFLEKLYKKLTENALFYGELRPMRKPVWRHIYAKGLEATHENGYHLVVTLKKR